MENSVIKEIFHDSLGGSAVRHTALLPGTTFGSLSIVQPQRQTRCLLTINESD
jgi:hypothetical protein